jgi:pimeloyl-ACP methyl ester carboxylesterase
MPNFKPIVLLVLSLLISVSAVACGVNSPAATPTLENSPVPTVTLTATPEVPQRPDLPAPTLSGAVDMGGYREGYACYGEGTPTVVVEAGAGDRPIISKSWNAVILKVQTVTRICIYDRASGNTTSQKVAENLHRLLTEASIPGPYLLVAHSLGGWHARVFTHLYPDEVAGLILVDTTSTSPDALITYATAYPTYSPDESAALTQQRLSEEQIFNEVAPSPDGLDMKTSNEQVRQAGSFGDLPLVVISQNPGPEDWLGEDPAIQKIGPAFVLKIQSDMTQLSTNSTFVVAHTSNHFISVYEPGIIVEAITNMVDEIRKR